MIKNLKRLGKKIIIYIVIFMILLSNMVSFGYTSSDVGSAVGGYTLNLLTWGNEENLPDGGPRLRYTQSSDRTAHPTVENPNPELPWYYDCSSFAADMYNMVCNQEILSYSATTETIAGSSSFDNLGGQASATKKPGDLICKADEHVEVFIDDEHGTGGAHGNRSRC